MKSHTILYGTAEDSADRLPDRFIWRQCPCPYNNCGDWHIVNFGKFVQGSGFTVQEKALLDALLRGNNAGSL